MSYLIWQDEKGNETRREKKGRGRVPRFFKLGDDENWYYDAAAAAAGVKPVIVRPPKQEKNIYLITLDSQGNEVERIRKQGPGRIPVKYIQRPDGNWYYSPDFMQPENSSSSAVPDIEEDVQKDIPKLIRIHARNKTTVDKIIAACNILRLERGDKTILERPVRFGNTGIPELDRLAGQPIFHKIEIDEEAKTVSVWSIAAPGGPYLIVEDVLEMSNGEKDASAPERN